MISELLLTYASEKQASQKVTIHDHTFFIHLLQSLLRETITGWVAQTKLFMYYSLFLSKCFCWWGKNSRLRNISMIFWCIYIVGLTPDEGGIIKKSMCRLLRRRSDYCHRVAIFICVKNIYNRSHHYTPKLRRHYNHHIQQPVSVAIFQ